MENKFVFPVGSEVVIDEEVPAIVVAITLRGPDNDVCYSVEWWDRREVKAREFDSFRVTPGKTGVQPIRLGFHGGETS